MKKFIGAIAAAVVLCWLSLVLAYNLDRLLTVGFEAMNLSFGDMIAALGSRNVRIIFLLLLGCSALLIFVALSSSASVDYKSKMRNVIPGLNLPEAAGDGQYGTARFMDPSRNGSVWKTAAVPKGDRELSLLIAQARDTEN